MNTIGHMDLKEILKNLNPKLNDGEFVFCVVDKLSKINPDEIVMHFKEKEGITVIIKKEMADQLNLEYSSVSVWITLTVHSSLAAVGLTSKFSTALAEKGISCNVVAAYFHDHIFVGTKDAEAAMNILQKLSQ